MKSEGWMSKHEEPRMNIKTRIAKDECQNVKSQRWMSIHEEPRMNVKAWRTKEKCRKHEEPRKNVKTWRAKHIYILWPFDRYDSNEAKLEAPCFRLSNSPPNHNSCFCCERNLNNSIGQYNYDHCQHVNGNIKQHLKHVTNYFAYKGDHQLKLIRYIIFIWPCEIWKGLTFNLLCWQEGVLKELAVVKYNWFT